MCDVMSREETQAGEMERLTKVVWPLYRLLHSFYEENGLLDLP